MDWQKTAENMEKRGFTVRHYATGAEAAEALCEELAGQEIGMGGSVTAAKEKGLLRSEGKEYVVKDGDMIYFRFNV